MHYVIHYAITNLKQIKVNLQININWIWMVMMGVIILLYNATFFTIQYINKTRTRFSDGEGVGIELPRLDRRTEVTDLGSKITTTS